MQPHPVSVVMLGANKGTYFNSGSGRVVLYQALCFLLHRLNHLLLFIQLHRQFLLERRAANAEPGDQKQQVLHSGRVQQQTHSVVLPFLQDAAVAVAPVKGHLLLLLLVQPDELLSRLRHKVVQAVQVALPLIRGALKSGKVIGKNQKIGEKLTYYSTICDYGELSYQERLVLLLQFVQFF